MANTGSRLMDASKQLSSAERDRMSALDMALYGKAMASEEDVVGSSVDFADEDWKMVEEIARSGGVRSWFASRVDFNVNGTRIRGKKGYSVGGGVVPLFDGAAIDLKKARMKAPKPEDARSDPIGGSPEDYQNWVEGTGGQMVLAPMGVQNVVPFRMDRIIVTEKGVMGTADKSFRFVRGSEEITGDSLILKGNYALLYGVSAKKEDREEPVHNHASLTRAGLQLYYLPKPEENRADIPPEDSDIPDLISGKMEISSSDNTDPSEIPDIPSAPANEENEEDDPLKKIQDLIILTEGNSDFDLKTEVLECVMKSLLELNANELESVWKTLPREYRNFLYRNMPDVDIRDITEKLAAWTPLRDFLGISEGKKSLITASGEKSFDLANIPVFPPFLDFAVTLTPEYSFDAYIGGEVQNLYSIWKAEEDKNTDITLKAGLKGHMSLKAGANMNVGAGYLLNASAGLYAKAKLAGSRDDDETFLGGKAQLILKKQNNGELVLADDINASIAGGLNLEGSVGAEGKIQSKLISWSHDLFSIEFNKWNLAELSMGLGFKKNKGNKNLFSGWSMTDANFTINGMLGRFLEKHTSATHYGFYTDANIYKESKEDYDKAEGVFRDAVGMLEVLRNDSEFYHKGMTTAPITDASARELEIQNEFMKSWSQAQTTLYGLTKQLENYQSDPYKKLIEEAHKNIRKHSRRLHAMKRYQKKIKSGETVQKTPLEYYKGLKSKPGSGFKRAMRTKAERTVYSYENALQYEKERLKEKAEKHEDRIKLLKVRAGSSGIPSDYKGRAVYSNKALAFSVQTLEAYERGRLETVTATKEKKIRELNDHINDPDFMEKYAKTLSIRELLQYGYPELLLYCERQRIDSLSNVNHELDALISTQANKTALEGNTPEAIRQYKNAKRLSCSSGEKTVAEIFGKDIYRTASADDLIQYEREQLRKRGGETLEELLLSYETKNKGSGEKPIIDGASLPAAFGITDEQNSTRKKQLKAHLKALKEEYQAWMKRKSDGELQSYLTLDLLLYYERKRLSELKSPSRKAPHEARIKWLEESLSFVDKASPENARELELTRIKDYFHEFSNKGVLTAVRNMQVIDLRLLQVSQIERIEALEKAKAEGKSQRELWELYEGAGGERDKISKKQEEKLKNDDSVTLDDIIRFEEYAVSASVMDEIKYLDKLTKMMDDKKSYQEMLDVYTTVKGNTAYTDYIKLHLGKGDLKNEAGNIYTPADIIEKEESFKARLGKKHQDRLDLIEANKSLPYEQLYALYSAQTKQDGTGFRRIIRHIEPSRGAFSLRNGFEKSLKGTLTREEVLAYEERRLAEVTDRHQTRIDMLTQTNKTSAEGQSSLAETQEPLTEEKKAELLQKYFDSASRFKTDAKTKAQIDQEEKRLLEAGPEEMCSNIIEYELERRMTYQTLYENLSAPISETETMISNLHDNITGCNLVIGNFKEIMSNPKCIWEDEKYADIKRMTDAAADKEKTDKELESTNIELSKLEQDIAHRKESEEKLQELLMDEALSVTAEEPGI